MELSDAISVVDAYLVFDEKPDGLREAIEKVLSAAEDYNFFANGENRATYRAVLQGKENRARQEGRNENRNYFERAICENHEIAVYGDYEPVNEFVIRFDKSGKIVRYRKVIVMPNHDTMKDALFDEALDELFKKTGEQKNE